ncbi:hypothetical protein [Fusibacter bizertensis]
MINGLFVGDWSELEGEIRARWTKLTEEDIDLVRDDIKKLESIVQIRYELPEEESIAEVEEFHKVWTNRNFQ